jgi:cellulose synthase/poly-beta-1,6-N-acetylglucosamine synthase-like glycosyltransferase
MVAAEIALDIVFVVFGAIVAFFATYLLVLALAAFFYTRAASSSGSVKRVAERLVVLVPAANEAELIARCVRSLANQTYARERYEIVVIADNCTDETANVAASAGAEVLVRDEPEARGKGRALRWAIDRLLASSPAPDVIVVVDADSVADERFLAELVARFEAGADAVQGESLLSGDGSSLSTLRAAAFLLVNRVRPAGRAVLHLPANLAGNGWLLSRDVLQSHPWGAFTSAEDVEYSTELRLAGIRPVFGGGAILHSPTAPNAEAAAQQQLRWEGGKLHVARTRIPKLIGAAVRRRDPSLLDAALEVAVPPLGVIFAAAALGTFVGALLLSQDLVAAWALVPWLVALAATPLFVLIGLRAGRAPASAYRALAGAPVFLCRKLLQTRRVLTFRSDSWVRTERPSERAGPLSLSAGNDVVEDSEQALAED